MIYNSQWQDLGSCVTSDGTTWVDLLEVPPEILAYPGAVFVASLRILAYEDDGVGAPDNATQFKGNFTITTSYAGALQDVFMNPGAISAVTTPVYPSGSPLIGSEMQIITSGSTAKLQVKGVASHTVRWAAIADVIGDNHP